MLFLLVLTGTVPALSLLAAGPIPGSQLNIPGTEKIVYKTVTDMDPPYSNLYVYVCKPQGWKASDTRSAMVFIHGGAFAFGDPSSSGGEYCRYFASRGMVTFNLEYRVAQMHTTTDKTPWNNWISESDCIEAIRWIRSRAATFGIATNRLIIGGASAGAIATLCATFGGKDVPPEFSCGDPKVSCVPDALYLHGGCWPVSWFKKNGPVPPPVLIQGGDKDALTSSLPAVGKMLNTFFAAQPCRQWRECRSDIASNGITNFVAGHTSFNNNQYGCRPAMIDMEEWFAALGFLPSRTVPALAEANGYCQIEAMDFSERSPHLQQNPTNAPMWQINYVKDAACGYVMDCVPVSAQTFADADLLKAPRLDYRIKFTTPGKYKVWAKIRASWETNNRDKYGLPEGPVFFRSQQLRLGVADGKTDRLLSGTMTTTADGYPSWQRIDATDPIVVSSAGSMTLKAYAASAGIRLERIILTTDPAYTPLAIARDLQVLTLKGPEVTDAGLAEQLKDRHGLQQLELVRTKVTDAGLAQLKELKDLRILSVWYTPILDAGLTQLKDLKNLTELCLNGTMLTDAGLENLKGLQRLQMLRIQNTKVTDTGLEKIFLSLPACTVIR